MNYIKIKQDIKHDGTRYIIKLPFKPHCEPLPDNYKLCKKRLAYLMRKFSKNKILKSEYYKIITDYEKRGIIEQVANSSILGKVHYLPHCEVVKEERESTKVRIVFDASAKGKGPSLNDCLYAGSSLIALVHKIMLLFWLYRFGLIADIQQAFLQVGVHESHREF